jgi:PTS system ascorbate-specific IIA component
VSIGILLITHPGIGGSMLANACRILGDCQPRVRSLEVPIGQDSEQLRVRAAELARELDRGDGVLVLTDLYGATPSNIACRLVGLGGVAVVAGLNLAMLLRALNYGEEPLNIVAERAVNGGQRGVFRFLECPADER